MKSGRRPEPVSVAKGLDELWLEVKCQSDLGIAGSPRNMFRHSAPQKPGGRATGWRFGPKGTASNQTPNTRCFRGVVRPWEISSLVKRETAQTVG